jgi:LysM repeat protein
MPKYRVKQGDTLSGIAASHGMSLQQLESLNPQIKHPDMIFPGQNVNLGKNHPASNGGGTASAGIGLGDGKKAIGGDANAVAAALNSAGHHNNGGNIPNGAQVISAPAVNKLGGGDFAGGAPEFPTTSTYPPIGQGSQQESSEAAKAGRFKNLGKKIKGWGFGKPPADPAQNAVYVNIPRNTNPLDIKDGKGHGPRPSA